MKLTLLGCDVLRRCGRQIAGAMALLGCAALVQAESLDDLGALTQQEFETLAENIGAATHYKSVAPIEPLGMIGFDVGFGLSSTEVDTTLYDQASSGDDSSSELLLPRLQVQKGLPLGLDLGASVATVPESDLTVLGAELRYALVPGNVALPAIGIRASYSMVQGNDDFDLNNTALELGISKGFLMLTPYAGIGRVRTEIDPSGVDTLQAQTVEQDKMFVGVTFNLGLALTVELENTGDYRTYSAKAGIRF